MGLGLDPTELKAKFNGRSWRIARLAAPTKHTVALALKGRCPSDRLPCQSTDSFKPHSGV